VSAATDLLSTHADLIESLTLITGDGGIYDVTVDGEMLYSKAEAGRHAEPGEVLELFTAKYGRGS
jgi:selenoprotein W-related protein